MELDKETERKLEAEDLERVGAWEPSIDPFQAVQTIPVSKIHHEKVRSFVTDISLGLIFCTTTTMNEFCVSKM